MMTMTIFIGLKGLESRKYVTRKGIAAGKCELRPETWTL